MPDTKKSIVDLTNNARTLGEFFSSFKSLSKAAYLLMTAFLLMVAWQTQDVTVARLSLGLATGLTGIFCWCETWKRVVAIRTLGEAAGTEEDPPPGNPTP